MYSRYNFVKLSSKLEEGVMDGPCPYIVEDFYQNPEAIRRVAVSLPYVQLPTFVKLYQSDRSLVSSYTVKALSDVVGHPIQYDSDNRTFGVFRLAMKSELSQTNVHRDLHDWSGVVYLCQAHHGISSGTGFFRHRATGLIGPPPRESSASELMAQIFSDGNDPTAWEMYDFVESKFNRLVIFRGRDYFHDTIGRFGDTRENARLTQNFFFSLKAE